MVLCHEDHHKHCMNQSRRSTLRCDTVSPITPCIVSSYFNAETWNSLLHFSVELEAPHHADKMVSSFLELLSITTRRTLHNCLLNFIKYTRTEDEHAFWFDVSSVWHTMFALLLYVETTNSQPWDDAWSMFCRVVLAHCSFCPDCYVRTRRSVFKVLVCNSMAPVLSWRMAQRIESGLARKLEYRREFIEERHARSLLKRRSSKRVDAADDTRPTRKRSRQ